MPCKITKVISLTVLHSTDINVLFKTIILKLLGLMFTLFIFPIYTQVSGEIAMRARGYIKNVCATLPPHHAGGQTYSTFL